MHTSYTTYLHLNELFTRLNCSLNWPVKQVLFTKLKRSPDLSVHKPELFTKIDCSPDWTVHQNRLFTILNCSLDWSVHQNELFTILNCSPDWSVHQTEVFNKMKCLPDWTVYQTKLFIWLNCQTNDVLFTRLKRSPALTVHLSEVFNWLNWSPKWLGHPTKLLNTELLIKLNRLSDRTVKQTELFSRTNRSFHWNVIQTRQMEEFIWVNWSSQLINSLRCALNRTENSIFLT